MSATKDDVQLEFDRFGSMAGMTKRSQSWYRATDEVISVLNLQKSRWSLKYYVNIGWWLRVLGDAAFPKEYETHVKIRLDDLLPDRRAEVTALLDLGRPFDNRRGRLSELLRSGVWPILESAGSIEGLRALGREGRLKAAAVRGPAIPVLFEGR
jgi:hypothetical protein